jgi:cytochrome c oxidase cbb3-type subunit 3
MSRYTDKELGHADESDGIEEYDNPLPDWWLGMFFISIIWGVGYAADFHLVSHHSQAGWYDQEVADAKVRWPDLQKAAAMDTSPATLEEGKVAFEKNCASCHTAAMTGGIGPNLIDDVWINGGEFEALVKTITEGVGAKGMPAWGPVLGPKTVAAAASYVLSKNEGEAGRSKNTAMGAYANVGGSAAAAPAPDAAATPAAPAADLPTPTVTPESVAAGQAIYKAKCEVCHGPELKGLVGPDLTDTTWIHGGELADIQRTIVNGVPDKGMITWKGQISDEEIAQVTTFIYSKSHPAK